MNRGNKILSSIAVAAFFVLTVFVFAPGHLFLTNAREFKANYFELLGYLLLIALPVFLLIAIVLSFLPGKYNIHPKAVALLFALSFLIWLQGNYLVWNYGLLNGHKVEYNTYFLIFDAVVWVTALVVILIKSGFFYRHIKFLSCVFITVQIISTTIMVYNQPDRSNLKRYELDYTNMVTFSEEKNIIILVLDTFQSDVFQKIIDEDSSYKDIFDGFTYYPDALAGFPTTICSVPNILTGQFYDNSIPYSKFLEKAYFSTNSIPKVLKEQGFEVDYFPDDICLDKRVISNAIDRQQVKLSTIYGIYDATLFRYLPDTLKRYIYNDGKWLLSNMAPAENVNSISGNQIGRLPRVPKIKFDDKTLTLGDVSSARDMMTYSNAVGGKYIFKFYRLEGCHPPFLLNEKLEYEDMAANVNGYERQAKGSLQITKIFLDELKELDVFDNSMIFIIGDHGIFGAASHHDAIPLFLVKKINSKGALSTSKAPVCLSDIPVTVFNELGIVGNFTGENIFNLKESAARERRFLYYDWSSPGYSDWSQDHLPPMMEYVVNGPVADSESWQLTGLRYIWGSSERSVIEWDDGFSYLEGTPEDNYRWCSAQGTLTINNPSNQDRKVMINAGFSTSYPEFSNLKIESSLFSENLKINNALYNYEKMVIIPPGRHVIKFSCDAMRDKPASFNTRDIVFVTRNFQLSDRAMVIATGNIKWSEWLEWQDGFSYLEGTSEDNWRWCPAQGTLTINNPSNQDRKVMINAAFATDYPEFSNLKIESSLFSENLKINNALYNYEKMVIIPPGRHVIKFNCDALRVKTAPSDTRVIVFVTRNFQLSDRAMVIATGNIKWSEWLEWQDGFSYPEGTPEDNWRWCPAQGTLTINNPSNQDRKVMINAAFATDYPEFSNLKIESNLFTDNLKINNTQYNYIKEVILPPGEYVIKFSCDAMRVKTTPPDIRYIVFVTRNFQITDE